MASDLPVRGSLAIALLPSAVILVEPPFHISGNAGALEPGRGILVPALRPARLADEHEGDGVLLGNDAGARAPRSERLRAARLRRQRHLAHHEQRSEEHTSELQSLMRISYAVF